MTYLSNRRVRREREPWALKNPVSQKAFGRSSKTHLENWSLRSSSSVNQNPIEDEGHDTLRHKLGTLASNMLSSASRRFYRQHGYSVYTKQCQIISALRFLKDFNTFAENSRVSRYDKRKKAT